VSDEGIYLLNMCIQMIYIECVYLESDIVFNINQGFTLNFKLPISGSNF